MNAELTVLHVVEKGEEPLTCPLVDEQVKKTRRVKEISFHGNVAKTIAEASNDLKPDLLLIGAEHKFHPDGRVLQQQDCELHATHNRAPVGRIHDSRLGTSGT
jgi:hypothetical protein